MRIFPAFQSIYNLSSKEDKTEYGAEVFTRTTKSSSGFIMPGLMTWDAIDNEVASWLNTSAEEIVLPSCLFINVSYETLENTVKFFNWLRLIGRFSTMCPVVIEVNESIEYKLLASRWDLLKVNNLKLATDGATQHFLNKKRRMLEWDYCKFNTQIMNKNDLMACVGFCQENNIQSIAERVETVEQCELALSVGLNLQQGYLHRKPELALSEKNDD